MAFYDKTCIYLIAKKQKAVEAFFIVFYLVGITGMLVPYTFPLFLKLIPLALLLSFIALALFHEGEVTRKIIIGFLAIFLLSFLIEAIGVNTGLVFGYYSYGGSLGLKLFQTPIIIGVNWLFLIYTTASLVDNYKIPSLAKIILASTGMVLYDIVLEQVAPKLNMWHWKNDIVPIQNYVAWFVLAFAFHSLLKVFKIKTNNKLSMLILVCQFLFFLILSISFKLMK